jgi:hypothetical protein
MDRLSDDLLADPRPAASLVLADSEDERAIGENFCQPPLLAPARALAELPLLPASRPLAVDLSFDDLPFDAFDALLLNDLPLAAPAAAARVEKKC